MRRSRSRTQRRGDAGFKGRAQEADEGAPPPRARGRRGLHPQRGSAKFSADDDTAKKIHGWASEVYPAVGEYDAQSFTRALGAAEVALGGGLLLPFVPSWLVGLGLAGFSGGLLNLYLKTPGMRQEGSFLPTSEGTALAKDVWMAGIAAMLLFDRESWFRRRRR